MVCLSGGRLVCVSLSHDLSLFRLCAHYYVQQHYLPSPALAVDAAMGLPLGHTCNFQEEAQCGLQVRL